MENRHVEIMFALLDMIKKFILSFHSHEVLTEIMQAMLHGFSLSQDFLPYSTLTPFWWWCLHHLSSAPSGLYQLSLIWKQLAVTVMRLKSIFSSRRWQRSCNNKIFFTVMLPSSPHFIYCINLKSHITLRRHWDVVPLSTTAYSLNQTKCDFQFFSTRWCSDDFTQVRRTSMSGQQKKVNNCVH